MLVETMNPKEILTEIKKDYDIIFDSTIQRLVQEYDRERRKCKIDARRTYCRYYPIKTRAKNNWLIFLSKPPRCEKYAGLQGINICPIVYHYNKEGLRVFYWTGDRFLVAYNHHFFSRYNERLGLQLNHPLDVVKEFFTKGIYYQQRGVEKGGKLYCIAITVDGLMLGRLQYDNTWIVWRTFVSKNLMYHEQDELEKALIENLREEIAGEKLKEDFGENQWYVQLDKLKVLTEGLRD